ncbi:RDD family protein [Corynebacterium sp. J010B-136]|uniref:RDD family protein n=1 Tax=Corynebacterium sp. J010B-136 TaxID=2099401 RepID=UPI000CF8BDCC|nr:RDD family protein [Corynebacterium sp. J010B-136]PQM75116.1 RDD family protein [Corynebacterium sp. J010B-136]
MRYRLSVLIRRAIGFWIDGFAVGAVILLIQWLINLAADAPLTGDAATLYQIYAFSLVFFAYRTIVEGRWNTSLGKWSLQLEIISINRGYITAAIRNSWVLLTVLAAFGIPYVEPTIVAILGLSIFGFAQHPFDYFTKTMVERTRVDN